jgi:molybdopterin-guanine dinucleotide biosynthesis protein A
MALLDGKPLIAHVGERLRQQAEKLAVAGHAAGAAVLQCELLTDPAVTVRGPLLGVLAALDWADAHGATWLVTAPCDAPLIPADLAARLISAATAQSEPAAIAATRNGLHPLCAVWAPRLAPLLRARLNAGVHPAVRDFAPGAPHVLFDDERAFANINTLAEFKDIGGG